MNLNSDITTFEDFRKILKIDNYHMLDETIEKLNNKKKVPLIVIDNAQFLFNFNN